MVCGTKVVHGQPEQFSHDDNGIRGRTNKEGNYVEK
jgi:rRNA maturation protein Nop10